MSGNSRDERRHGQDRKEDQRTPGQRDRDRILYSSAFRRLGGVTQVAAPSENFPLHTRLTHSLEVAQIGYRLAEEIRRRAEDLGYRPENIDADVVETAALAHDLGHPPFGHIAEEELDKEIKGVESGSRQGGFGGNAQSFRVVTKLARRHRDFDGLNLTRATLAAIMKYPWLRDNTPEGYSKWGSYFEEQDDFEWVFEGSASSGVRSTEAELMDWADDVAYAVHDMEDFFRAGFIPLDRLARLTSEAADFWDDFQQQSDRLFKGESMRGAHKRFEAILKTIGERVSEPFSGSSTDRANLRTLTSTFIARFILQPVEIDRTKSTNENIVVLIDPRYRTDVSIMKHFTWYYVINRGSLATQQYGQRKIIRDLFRILRSEAANAHREGKAPWVLPFRCREQLDTIDGGATQNDREIATARIIGDYIASLTEGQCIALHRRLMGTDLGSLVDPIEA